MDFDFGEFITQNNLWKTVKFQLMMIDFQYILNSSFTDRSCGVCTLVVHLISCPLHLQ